MTEWPAQPVLERTEEERLRLLSEHADEEANQSGST